MQEADAPKLRALLIAVGLHAVLVILLVAGFRCTRSTPASAPQGEVIEATLVETPVAPARNVQREQELAEQKRKEEEQKRLEEAQQRRQQEQQRKAELAEQKRQAEETRKKAAETERLKKEIAAKNRALEDQKKAAEEAEKKRIAEEEKRRQAAEETQKRIQEEERRLAEEETRQKAQADEKARKEAAERAAQQAREKAMQDALAKEQAQRDAEAAAAARQNELRPYINAYIAAIREKIQRNWTIPPGAPENFKCEVLVTQQPDGRVVGVRVVRSCGSEALNESIEKAVRKADPLPLADPPEIFDREVIMCISPTLELC